MRGADRAFQTVREQLAAANRSTSSKGEAEFYRQCIATGLYLVAGGLEREYLFARPRRWRFDFAWPAVLVAVEVEGVVHDGKGRHQMAAGYAADCEKYNSATLAGWRVLRGTPKMINSGWILNHAEQLLKGCDV